MSPTALRTVLAVSTALLPAGCALEPRYDLRVVEEQKDAFLVLVSLGERLSPGEYRRIAEKEVQSFLAARLPRDVPVYEVRIDFLLSSGEEGKEQKLATFWWTSIDGSLESTLLAEGEHLLFLY